jgi:hypothetical protein
MERLTGSPAISGNRLVRYAGSFAQYAFWEGYMMVNLMNNEGLLATNGKVGQMRHFLHHS